MLDNWIDFRAKKLRKKEHYTMIKWSTPPPRRHSDPKCVCTKQDSFKIQKTKTDKTKSQIHKYIWGFQYPIEVLDKKKSAKI